MRERATGWFASAGSYCRLGAAAAVAISLIGATAATQAAESPALVASLYGGSDLTGGQSAWPPHGAPKAGTTQPPWPTTEDDSEMRSLMPPIGGEPAERRFRTQAAQGASEQPPGPDGLISEIRLGVLAHDVPLLAHHRESGTDVTAELLFGAPGFLDLIGSPRPHVGLAVNTVGDTSQLYGGLTWDWNFFGPLFVEGTLGLAVHDGELNGSPGHKALGSRVLFRESVAVGARFLARHTISLVFAHISNADLCADNDGLDTFGIRYGYAF